MRATALALATALATAVALVVPAGAAPKPQITDPAGDALPGAGAGWDVVSALFATTGTTAKVGRKPVYTPTRLVVTVTYAGDVPADTHAAQVVTFDAPGCPEVYLERFAAGTYATASCVQGDLAVTARTSGRTLTFTVPFGVLGPDRLKKGAVLTALRTYTAVADPVLGYETQETGGLAGAVDDASTGAPYRIG